MSQDNLPKAEVGVTTAAQVAPSLGFPNNRPETSPQPTGWQASSITTAGTPDQSSATVEKIGK
ncbi:MAG: hypothetical protein ACKORF_07605 [Micrococcales bacterium]